MNSRIPARKTRSLYHWLSKVTGTHACWVEGVDKQDTPVWGFIKRLTGQVYAIVSRRLLLGSLLLAPALLASTQQALAQHSVNLSGLSGSTGFTLGGISPGDQTGKALAVGDINGDGLGDMIIGAPAALSNKGVTYVVFGKAEAGTSINLASLDGTSGFVLKGTFQNNYTGQSVASGDINGDGIDDVIIGGPKADYYGQYSGMTYVVFGKTTPFSSSIDLEVLNGTTGFALIGIGYSDYIGQSVASGDINGDGKDDVIIGGSRVSSNKGATYVVFGKTELGASIISLSTLNGSTGFVLNGVNAGDLSGQAVASGDMNGDGIGDVVIGAQGADPNGNAQAGQTYVVFGKTGGFTSAINLSSLNGVTGFALNGGNEADYSGFSVASGDMNGDGIGDVLIGAPLADPNGNENAGETYVAFGKTEVGASIINLSALDGATGFALNGIIASDQSGWSVASGDMNGDGVADLLIGAPLADPNGNNAAGESYVVFGQSTFAGSVVINLSTLNGSTGFALNGVSGSDQSGRTVVSGDINGDGVSDVLVGAPYATYTGFDRGVGNVMFGRPAFTDGVLSLNGVEGEILVEDANVLDLTHSFTLEAWARPDSYVAFQWMMAKVGAFGFGFKDSKLLFTTFGIKDYELEVPTLQLGRWVHLAVVFDENFDATFYVDGREAGTVVGTAQAHVSAASLGIGRGGSASSGVFNGQLDEVRIWNTKRSVSELRAGMFDAPDPSSSPGLVGYWDFAQPGGRFAPHDVSNNALGGQLRAGAALANEKISFSAQITGGEGWRMLSSPASGAVLDELLAPLWTQGVSTGGDTPTGTPNVYLWDPTLDTNSASNSGDWVAITDLAGQQVSAGQGFLMYIFSDDNGPGSGDAGFPKQLRTADITSVGVASLDTVVVASALGNGRFFLAGNPYPKVSLDWDSDGIVKTQLSQTIYIYDPATSNFRVWNGTLGDIEGGMIAPFQSFFFQSMSAGGQGELRITRDAASDTLGTFYKPQHVAEHRSLKIQAQAGEHRADAWLSFQQGGQQGRDSFDGLALRSFASSYLQLGTLEAEDVLSINVQDILPDTPRMVFPLLLQGKGIAGEAQVSFEGLEDFEGWELSILDTQTGDEFSVEEGARIELDIQAVNAKQVTHSGPPIPMPVRAKDSSAGQRYQLVVKPGDSVKDEELANLPSKLELDQNFPNPFNPTTSISFALPQAGNVRLEVFDLLGRKVSTLVNARQAAGRFTVNFDASSLSSGVYIYRLQAGGSVLTKKLTLIK